MGQQHWTLRRCVTVTILGIGLLAGQLLAEEPAGTIELANLQKLFRAVADRQAASVVAISTSAIAMDADQAIRADSLNGDKLDAMLQRTTRTVGTGFIIDGDGYILTNEHVIGQTAQIWITTDDRKVYPAIIVGSDPRADLAVLKAPAHGLQAVRFARGAAIHRGMWTIAMGNPYGLAGAGEMSMSVGIISATDRSLPKLASQERRLYSNLIQTTAEINPGNSGGPLFDIDGNVIGISTAVILPQKSTFGIGFAIPINDEFLARVDDLKQGKEVKYAYLGVMVSAASDYQRKTAHLDRQIGVSIDAVEVDSPAFGMLKSGDIVTQIDGLTVDRSEQFVRLVGDRDIGEPTRLCVRRDGQPLNLSIQLRQRELPSVAVSRENQRIRWRGMLLGPIPAHWTFSPASRPAHGLMVLGIDSTSPMSSEGVHSGTIITSIAGKAIDSVSDLQDILNQTPAELCKVQIAPAAVQAVASGDTH